MTSMLHLFPDGQGASAFDARRQLAELRMVVDSPSAAKTLADNYVGLPLG
jgi:p-hydroxybenzoate 3-monooxygenase